MLPAGQRHATYEQYLDLERTSDGRHEFLDGEICAMSGGSIRHSRIKTNLAGELYTALEAGPCLPYDSDLRVRVLATGLATYPDLTVVCGDLERHPDDPNAVTNPTAAFEVLSDSTEAWDRGGKFRHLSQIPSLRHYVLVSQDPPGIEVYTRLDGEIRHRWELVRYGVGERVVLPGLGVEIELDRVYRHLPPEPDPGASEGP